MKRKKIEIYIYSLFVRKEEFERALKRATKHKEKFKRESCRNTIQKTGITLVFFCADDSMTKRKQGDQTQAKFKHFLIKSLVK